MKKPKKMKLLEVKVILFETNEEKRKIKEEITVNFEYRFDEEIRKMLFEATKKTLNNAKLVKGDLK